MLAKSMLYAALFTLIDLTLYFLVYVLHAVAARPLSLGGALLVGGYAVAWRVIYFQAVLQVSLLAALRYYDKHGSATLTVLAAVVAFVIPALFYFGGTVAAAKLFTADAKSLGEGLTLLFSVLMTWIFCTNVLGGRFAVT